MEVEMKIRGLMMDPVTNMPIVILKDVNGNSILPIWVGIYEANAIALEIEKVTYAAPDDSRPDQDHAPGSRNRDAEGGGERVEGRHVLRCDLAGAGRRNDHGRLTAERCAGAGASPGLPDLRRRFGLEISKMANAVSDKVQQRRAAALAGGLERRGSGPLQDVSTAAWD